MRTFFLLNKKNENLFEAVDIEPVWFHDNGRKMCIDKAPVSPMYI